MLYFLSFRQVCYTPCFSPSYCRSGTELKRLRNGSVTAVCIRNSGVQVEGYGRNEMDGEPELK